MYPVWRQLPQVFSNAASSDSAWDRAWASEGFSLDKGGIWSLFEAKPEREQQFGRAMSALDGLGAKAMVADGPFALDRFKRFVDLGGSRGHFLWELLEAFPERQGVLFDRAGVVEMAERAWKNEEEPFSKPSSKSGSAPLSRVSFRKGDFFQMASFPEARENDLFFLRNILHDWDAAGVKKILANVRGAIGDTKDSTLLIGECAMPERSVVGAPPVMYNIDLHMMAAFGEEAQERSPSEWQEVLKEAGFEMVRIWGTRSFLHWVEAKPI